jgi:hypothetical protein
MPRELAGKTVVEWTTLAQALVLSNDAKETLRLEKLLGCTQAESVNHFVQDSCCSDDMPEDCGGGGRPHDRRAALRALWLAYAKEEGTDHV